MSSILCGEGGEVWVWKGVLQHVIGCVHYSSNVRCSVSTCNVCEWEVQKPCECPEYWVKRDQLDATCFIITLFSAQHVSNVNTSILRSLRLIRSITSWVVSGSMCVGVTLQCGYGGVVSVCRLKRAYRYHTTTAKPQRNTNTHRTRYSPWSNWTN